MVLGRRQQGFPLRTLCFVHSVMSHKVQHVRVAAFRVHKLEGSLPTQSPRKMMMMF